MLLILPITDHTLVRRIAIKVVNDFPQKACFQHIERLFYLIEQCKKLVFNTKKFLIFF